MFLYHVPLVLRRAGGKGPAEGGPNNVGELHASSETYAAKSAAHPERLRLLN